eukprot:6192911-Pleurochrysis_carterae.AAC.1
MAVAQRRDGYVPARILRLAYTLLIRPLPTLSLCMPAEILPEMAERTARLSSEIVPLLRFDGIRAAAQARQHLPPRVRIVGSSRELCGRDAGARAPARVVPLFPLCSKALHFGCAATVHSLLIILIQAWSIHF